MRVNGSSFYSFPFALSLEYHRALFDNQEKNPKLYFKLLFEAILLSIRVIFLQLGDMAELVDASDSKSGAFGRSGSTPDIPTK